MEFDTSNPLLFVIDCIINVSLLLGSVSLWGVNLLFWSFAFIVIGMIVSVFWRGARG